MNEDSQPSLMISELDARLHSLQQRQQEDQIRRFHRRLVLPGTTLQFASRVFNDLVAAVLISIAVGASIDAAFDSWPWGILGMFLLGAAAAVRNVHQTASQMADTEVPEKPGATITGASAGLAAPMIMKRG